MVCADLQKTSRSLQTSVVESDLAGHTGHQALLDAMTQGGTIPKAKFVQTNCISSSCPAPSCNSQPFFFFSICLFLLVGKAMGLWPKLDPSMNATTMTSVPPNAGNGDGDRDILQVLPPAVLTTCHVNITSARITSCACKQHVLLRTKSELCSKGAGSYFYFILLQQPINTVPIYFDRLCFKRLSGTLLSNFLWK